MMGAFVEGGSIAIRFRQGSDVRADGFQKVAIGNDTDKRAMLDDQQMMKSVFLKETPDCRKRVVHCDSDDTSGHDGTGTQFSEGGLHGRFRDFWYPIIGGLA